MVTLASLVIWPNNLERFLRCAIRVRNAQRAASLNSPSRLAYVVLVNRTRIYTRNRSRVIWRYIKD